MAGVTTTSPGRGSAQVGVARSSTSPDSQCLPASWHGVAAAEAVGDSPRSARRRASGAGCRTCRRRPRPTSTTLRLTDSHRVERHAGVGDQRAAGLDRAMPLVRARGARARRRPCASTYSSIDGGWSLVACRRRRGRRRGCRSRKSPERRERLERARGTASRSRSCEPMCKCRPSSSSRVGGLQRARSPPRASCQVEPELRSACRWRSGVRVGGDVGRDAQQHALAARRPATSARAARARRGCRSRCSRRRRRAACAARRRTWRCRAGGSARGRSRPPARGAARRRRRRRSRGPPRRRARRTAVHGKRLGREQDLAVVGARPRRPRRNGAGAGAQVVLGDDVGGRAELARELDARRSRRPRGGRRSLSGCPSGQTCGEAVCVAAIGGAHDATPCAPSDPRRPPRSEMHDGLAYALFLPAGRGRSAPW